MKYLCEDCEKIFNEDEIVNINNECFACIDCIKGDKNE